jgi:Zn-dependent peptidase ImmA (M78 family)
MWKRKRKGKDKEEENVTQRTKKIRIFPTNKQKKFYGYYQRDVGSSITLGLLKEKKRSKMVKI